MSQALHNNERSAMENYFLMKKLPEFAVIKQPKHVEKNHQYYHNNFNIWNNSHQTQEKNYIYYHKQQDEAKERINQMHDQQILDQKKMEEYRKQILLEKKDQDLDRMGNRKLERMALQIESSQQIDQLAFEKPDTIATLSTYTQKSFNKTFIKIANGTQTGRADHSWNRLNQCSKKFLEQTVNEKIISNDEKAVQVIAKRIEKDERDEQIRKESFKKNHTKIREAFLKQHKSNLEFEQQCGLVPDIKPKIIHLPYKNTTSSNSNNDNEYNLSGKSSSQHHQRPHTVYSNSQGKPPINQHQGTKLQKNLQADSLKKDLLDFEPKLFLPHDNDYNLTIKQAHEKKLSLTDYLFDQRKSGLVESDKLVEENQKSGHFHKSNQSQSQEKKQQQQQHLQNANANNLDKSQQQQQQQQQQSKIIQLQQQHPFFDTFQTNEIEREFLSSAGSQTKRVVFNDLGDNNNFNNYNNRPITQQEQYRTRGLTKLEDQQEINSFPLKNYEQLTSHRDHSLPVVQRLSESKKQGFLPINPLDRSEYKGLLVTEIDHVNCNNQTDFTKLMMQTNTVQNNLNRIQTSSRPGTRQSKVSKVISIGTIRPSTTMSMGRQSNFQQSQNDVSPKNSQTPLQLDDDNQVIIEINTFEKNVYHENTGEGINEEKKRRPRKVGFPKISLQEAKRIYQENEAFEVPIDKDATNNQEKLLQ